MVPITPGRFLDTRPTGDTIDDVAEAGVRPTDGSTTQLQIAGRGVASANASAVIVNVTAIGADDPGFVTVHACLDTPPNAASLNYVPRVNRGNELVATLDANGQICIFTSAGTHLAADVVGYLPPGSGLTSVTPGRLLDTRPTGVTVDGEFQPGVKCGADTQLGLQVAGRHGIPDNVTSAVINWGDLSLHERGNARHRRRRCVHLSSAACAAITST